MSSRNLTAFGVIGALVLILGGGWWAARCARARHQEHVHDTETPMQPSLKAAGAAAILATATLLASAQVQVDPRFPDYKQVQGVSGNIKSIGSDTMNNLMAGWAEGFKKMYPSVGAEIEGKGSATAPPALIESTANFGPMSREMKKQEIDDFEKKFGYKPTPVATAIDMLAVYVHKDNPIKGLTLAQVDAAFSKTRKLGTKDDVSAWGQLGLVGDWAQKPISLFGRNSASGTYGYFKEHVLGKGDFKDSVKEQPGSSSVVQGVASDKSAMGYSGIGYKTADVRAVPIAKSQGQSFVSADFENAYNGDYPICRPLLVYVNHKPDTQLEPLRREFLRYVFSKQGQLDVIKDGYLPVTFEMAKDTLASVGITIEETAK
jgi:phosphate transport system substrate-binding protein